MEKIIEHFIEHGWAVVDFSDPSPVFVAREALQKQLNFLLGKECPLEQYHKEAQDDQRHTDFQIQMTQYFREQRFGPKIIKAQLEFFQKMVGQDLLVQANPYLRMNRPGKPQDNIGYHRDTFYGGSPYEISVLIPFVDLEANSSLGMLSGSHILSESFFPTVQIQNPDTQVTKGSAKHQLGFLYAPKLMDSSIEKNMKKIPLKIGQALIFSLSTVHGSVVNSGQFTRWSIDTRVLNALAPVDLTARPNYYEFLNASPVTACAKKYFEANLKTEDSYV